MKQIVIMPGGFHPFHAGHFALYKSALEAFPQADVYVAATNDQSERPFPFSIKEKLAKLAGVAPGRFVQVKSPFQAKEITQNYNPEEDVLIFVRSEKDRNEQPKPGGTKKDGSPAYFQPWTGKNLQPFSKHAYIAYLPTVTFGPGIQSATEIRKAWPTLDDRRKTAMVMSLYPATQKNPKLAQNVVQLLDVGMDSQQGVAEGWKTGAALGGIAGGIAGGPIGAAAGAGLGAIVGGVRSANKKQKELEQMPGFVKHRTPALKYILDKLPKTKYGELVMSADPNLMQVHVDTYDNLIEKLVPQYFENVYGEEKGSYLVDSNKKLVKGISDTIAADVRWIISITKGPKYKQARIDTIEKLLGNDPKYLKYFGVTQPDEFDDIAEQGVAEGLVLDEDAGNKLADQIVDALTPVVKNVHKEKVPDYVDQARELLSKSDDPTVRKRLLDIFKTGKENPYLQGGIITTVGALLAGGILNTSQSMGLTPQQTNIALQAILNTVIPTLVSRINGRNWKDTIKYTLASAGVGTGIATIAENQENQDLDYLEEK